MSIGKIEYDGLRKETMRLLARKFEGKELALRMRAWNLIYKALCHRHPSEQLKDAAVQAYQTAKGMKIGPRTIAKLEISLIEAQRKSTKKPLPKKTGQRLSKLQHGIRRI